MLAVDRPEQKKKLTRAGQLSKRVKAESSDAESFWLGG